MNKGFKIHRNRAIRIAQDTTTNALSDLKKASVVKAIAEFDRLGRNEFLAQYGFGRPRGLPNHPRWVGVVCPNCHRQIHHGAGGKEINSKLQSALALLEPEEAGC
jgi:hypothetical protein